MVCHRQPGRRQRPGTGGLAPNQQTAARQPYRSGVCLHRAQVPCDRAGSRSGQQRFPQTDRRRRRRHDPRGRQRPVHPESGADAGRIAERNRRRYRQRLDPDVRYSAQIFRSDPRDRRGTLVPAGRRNDLLLPVFLPANPLHGQRGGGGIRRSGQPALQPPQGRGQTG